MSFQVSTKLSVELSKVRAAPVLKEIRKEDWLASGWRNISLSRTLFDGDVAEPMLVQTDLPKHDLKTRLLKNGWRENKLSVLATLTDSMVPSKEPLKKRSVLPSTNAGKPPVLVFQKSIGPNSKAVLRIWETDYAINGEGLFSLSLMQESLRKVPFKLSLISKQQFPQDVQVELMSSIEVALNCLKFNKQADATEISLLVRR